MAPAWPAVCRTLFLALILFLSPIIAAPSSNHHALEARQSTSTEKMVFCHFMIGVSADRTSAKDYDADMIAAKKAGIKAFALNIGTDSYTDTQLGFAYDSAAANGMNVFLSFDFNWYSATNATQWPIIGSKIGTFASKPAQLKIGDAAFVSSFAGDGLNLDAVKAAAGGKIFFVPNFKPENLGSADGLLNWMAWPSNGQNKAPDATGNVAVNHGDTSYQGALGRTKPYIAPVSAWFSTHYGLEVSYSKNWVFPSNSLWYDRWTEVLGLNPQPQYLELLTWNDYGESHYIGPLSSPHSDDGNSKWTNDMPHDGWLSMATPYISAFKAGSKTVDSYITTDQLIYWYRPHPKSASCDSTDTCEKPWPSPSPNPNYFVGKPNGADSMADSVFLVAMLTQAGTVKMTSGSNTQSFPATAGSNSFSIPMGAGKQSFSFTPTKAGGTVLSGTSLKDVVDGCVCGIYNFNAYVGTLPLLPADHLQPAGLAAFTTSLNAQCLPTPSLGTDTGATAVPSGAGPTPTIPSPSRTGSGGGNGGGIPPPPPPASSSLSSPPSAAPVANAKYAPQPSPVPVAKGTRTITALAQLASANCLMPGDVWAGPAGSDPPAQCDLGH